LKNVNTVKNNNTITTTYSSTEFKTLFGGEAGECSMRILSPLSTLPELVSIGTPLDESNILEHFYAVHTFIDSNDKSDFKVDIWPVLSN